MTKAPFLECQPEAGDGEENKGGGSGEEGDGEENEDGGGGGACDSARPVIVECKVELEAEVERLRGVNVSLRIEVRQLRDKIEGEKRKYKGLWRESCE